MDYEPYVLQGEAKSTEFSDDRSYLLVKKQTAIVRQTEECWLPKIVLSYDFACYFLHWIGVWLAVTRFHFVAENREEQLKNILYLKLKS